MLDADPTVVGSSNEPTPSPAMSGSTKTHSVLPIILEQYGLVLMAGVSIIVFSFLPATSATFPTLANLRTELGGNVVLCIVSLAFMLPLTVGFLDLSIASITGLSSVLSASAMSRFHAPLAVAVAVAIGIGLLVGAVNGFLVARLKLDAIIVTLAMMTVISGIVLWYTNGLSIDTGISSSLTNFGSLTWLSIPRVVYLLLIVVIAVWYALERTPFGRYLRMIGSNRSAARLVGIAVDRTVFINFVVAGGLAGLAGILLTAQNGGANPQDGPGFLIPGLVAVYLGTTAIQPGRFNVVGSICGVFFVATIETGLNLAGVAAFVEPLFDGAALLIAVLMSTMLRRRRSHDQEL